MRPTIIVMSHGKMAEETVNSAKMIVGDIDRIFTVSMKEDDGLAGTTEKLTAILDNLDPSEEILILADLKGGTPCNVAMMKMAEYPNLHVVAGLNLAMLIESIFSPLDSSNEVAAYLETIGKAAVENIQPVTLDEEDEYEE